MIKRSNILQIGIISKSRGVAGELEVRISNSIFDYGNSQYFVLDREGIFIPFFWKEYKFKNNDTIIIKFLDVENEKQAKNIIGSAVYYPLQFISKEHKQENSLEIQSLIGYAIKNQNNILLGIVIDIDISSVNTLLKIRDNAKNKEYIIPYHIHFLVNHDLSKKEIILNLPNGILNI